jgi:hypothetical protein
MVEAHETCEKHNLLFKNCLRKQTDPIKKYFRGYSFSLTFLSLCVGSSASSRNSAGKLLEVDVAVVVLIEGREQRLDKHRRKWRRYQRPNDLDIDLKNKKKLKPFLATLGKSKNLLFLNFKKLLS